MWLGMQTSLRLAFNVTAWHPSIEEWIFAGKCIQSEERKRISEFHYKNDAKLGLIGRLLLRYAITLCTDIKWKDLHLIRNAKSKPLLDSRHLSTIKFNASHQGDFVVVVTDNSNVGVDVMDARERHGDVAQFFHLMRRHFTVEEWQDIELKSSPDSRMEAFYRHWCLKESYVKATGAGIGYSLLSLNFVPHSPLSCDQVISDTSLYHNGLWSEDWSFEECLIGGGSHIVAVARHLKDSNNSPTFKELSFAEIISKGQPLVDDTVVDRLFFNCYDNPFKPNRR